MSLLRAWDVTVRYADGTTALSDLSIDVPRGSVGLVGANGAGKTTLFRLMLGLMAPVQGQLEVVGRPVASDPLGVRARLGYMPEHDCLPADQSAADFVASFGEIAGLTPRAARQRASDVLDLVGLDEARFRAIGGFSTGMRQRTKLAQALVAGPEAVLLDEPTSGLDPVGRDEMLALVERLAGLDISLVFATHLLDDVQQVCEHVVMLDAGHLALVGRVDELVQRTGVVRVEVGAGPAWTSGGAGAATVADPTAQLVEVLASRAVAAGQVGPGTVDIDTTGRGEEVLDVVRDTVADLGLRLYSLSSRHRSLDDVVQAEVVG